MILSYAVNTVTQIICDYIAQPSLVTEEVNHFYYYYFYIFFNKVILEITSGCEAVICRIGNLAGSWKDERRAQTLFFTLG